ncbi:MAG: M20 metallopeptidase family protein [Bacillota bacterium]
MYTNEIKKISSVIIDEIILIRREIHKFPELGFREYKTASIISDYLEGLGLKVYKNIGKTGVVGLIEGSKPGKTIAVRADMDALPITEENSFEYASQYKGVMHACGHDAHVAIALGAAKILGSFKDSLPGNIKFIFQPAEEGLGGARFMIDEGVLENPKVDTIIALHVSPGLKTGQISVGTGPVMASPSEFEIVIKGKGGHAAEPHKIIDPIVTGVNIINLFQTIIPKKLSPFKNAVLSVTCFNAGNTFNVIPSEAVIKGTVRTFDSEVDSQISESMKSITAKVSSSMGADYTFDYKLGYPPVVNNHQIVDLIIKSSSEVIAKENILTNPDPVMLAEDFSYYAQRVPGALFNLGCTNPKDDDYHNLHSSRFSIDETCIAKGMEIVSQCVINYLKEI